MKQETSFHKKLASSWTDFVDCPKRLKTLGIFLEKHLSKYKDGEILDSALGIGCESIFLKTKGFNVVSNEIDTNLIYYAIKFAKERGIDLEVIQQDWREIDYVNKFSGILNLGNSLCLLNNLEDIRLALKNFYKALDDGGVFIVDQRNFNYIIDNKIKILLGEYRYSGKFIYCGKNIKGIPIRISNNEVIFGYFKGEELLGTLKMFPFKNGELYQLLLETGFKKIKEFSDFKLGHDIKSDFYTYIAIK